MNKQYGIFVHSGGTGVYKAEEAIKWYKSESSAKKYADKLNEVNCVHVVRPTDYVTFAK